jgi:hypothetical protein
MNQGIRKVTNISRVFYCGKQETNSSDDERQSSDEWEY